MSSQSLKHKKLFKSSFICAHGSTNKSTKPAAERLLDQLKVTMPNNAMVHGNDVFYKPNPNEEIYSTLFPHIKMAKPLKQGARAISPNMAIVAPAARTRIPAREQENNQTNHP
jgi:hypothetical protein